MRDSTREEFWKAVGYAVADGASLRDMLTEVEDCYVEVTADVARDAQNEVRRNRDKRRRAGL